MNPSLHWYECGKDLLIFHQKVNVNKKRRKNFLGLLIRIIICFNNSEGIQRS